MGVLIMAAMDTLIVFYSRTGTTRGTARRLAASIGCDMEEIVESRSRRGVGGYVRSCIEAIRRRPSRWLTRTHRDPTSYDLVIIGTPVWAWSVSSPVRAWLMAHKDALPDLAFFCTCGGAGADRAFAQMRQLVGKPPKACMVLTAPDIASADHAKIDAFARTVAPLKLPAIAA
jgi:flavodoxin